MLFMVTQTHTAECCPKDAGGSDSLVDKGANGVALKGCWGTQTHRGQMMQMHHSK